MKKLIILFGLISPLMIPLSGANEFGLIERLEKLEKNQNNLLGALSKSILVSPKSCTELPGSWKEASVGSGQFLLGQGGEFKALMTGGHREIKLDVNHMPAHRHSIATNNKTNIHDGLGGSSNSYGILKNFKNVPNTTSWRPAVLPKVLEEVGGSKPHDNMPPYVVVYFCQYHNKPN